MQAEISGKLSCYEIHNTKRNVYQCNYTQWKISCGYFKLEILPHFLLTFSFLANPERLVKNEHIKNIIRKKKSWPLGWNHLVIQSECLENSTMGRYPIGTLPILLQYIFGLFLTHPPSPFADVIQFILQKYENWRNIWRISLHCELLKNSICRKANGLAFLKQERCLVVKIKFHCVYVKYPNFRYATTYFKRAAK